MIGNKQTNKLTTEIYSVAMYYVSEEAYKKGDEEPEVNTDLKRGCPD